MKQNKQTKRDNLDKMDKPKWTKNTGKLALK